MFSVVRYVYNPPHSSLNSQPFKSANWHKSLVCTLLWKMEAVQWSGLGHTAKQWSRVHFKQTLERLLFTQNVKGIHSTYCNRLNLRQFTSDPLNKKIRIQYLGSSPKLRGLELSQFHQAFQVCKYYKVLFLEPPKVS